jgi:hypothetical protein
MLFGIILGPVVFQIAQLSRHLGALSGPLMSAVNFFQSADLFSNLDLHWPKSWIAFIHSVAAVFNLRMPAFLSFINPECSFELAYFEKFILMMISPMLLVIAMALFVQARVLIARLAVKALRRYADTLPMLMLMYQISAADADVPGQMDPLSKPINISEPGPQPEPERSGQEHAGIESLDMEPDADSTVETDAPKKRCAALKTLCRELASPGGPRRILIRTMQSLATFDRAAMTMQMLSILLVYLMVGYVALVSGKCPRSCVVLHFRLSAVTFTQLTAGFSLQISHGADLAAAALEPLGCADVYGRRVMTHQTTIIWCVIVAFVTL